MEGSNNQEGFERVDLEQNEGRNGQFLQDRPSEEERNGHIGYRDPEQHESEPEAVVNIPRDQPEQNGNQRGRESDQESEEAVADYDYAFQNIEYLKPVLVRFPGGKIAIGTESSDPNWSKIMCWRCLSKLAYPKKEEKIKCYKCEANIITKLNNSEQNSFVKCLNCACELLVPEEAMRVYCPNCKSIFMVSQLYSVDQRIELHQLETD